MARALTRWDPFADIGEMRARFNRLLDQFEPAREREWIPDIDMLRDDGNLVVRADVPGVKPEEIKIEVADGVLMLSGEHEETKERKDQSYVRRERRYGAFSRSIPLPDRVKVNEIRAKTHDGILEVTIPLPEERPQERVTITPEAAE